MDHLVAHGLDRWRAAARNDDHGGVRHLGEGLVGGDGEGRVGGHGLDPFGHDHRLVLVVEAAQDGEDLQRPDHVEQGDTWIEDERDCLGLLGCHR
jgi:hypothetical protein